jgi:hypothetical protein
LGESPQSPLLSICIVNWNTRDELRYCLRSLLDHPGIRTANEIIVIDNGSSDGSSATVAREFPRVRLIANEKNEGYARGNNQAIEVSRGDFILLLNPDTRVLGGCVERLAAFLQARSEAGGVAPRLISPDGTTQRSVRSFPTPAALWFDALGLARLFRRFPFFSRYRMLFWDQQDMREVDQPMASALMLRRKAVEQTGSFDERFPLFFNDVDMCYRLKQAGWKIYYLPDAVVVHTGGASTRQVREFALRESHRSLAEFYRKHYAGKVCWASYWATVSGARAGLVLRLLALRLMRTRSVNKACPARG